jgi:hypothetical protein
MEQPQGMFIQRKKVKTDCTKALSCHCFGKTRRTVSGDIDNPGLRLAYASESATHISISD